MADNTAPVEDTSDDDVSLEDMDLNFDDVADDESESTVSEDKPEDKTEDESAEKESEEEAVDEEAQADESTETTEEESDEDKQKSFNNEMAQKRIQEREQRKAQEAQQKDQQQEYISEAGDDDVQTAVRQLQVDAYNNKVEGNTNKLTNGYERAVKDFPILSDQTPEIQAEVNAAIDAFQSIHVKIDQWGNPSEVSGDLYKYLQSKADSIERLTQIGARKQGDDKIKEKSKVMTPPSKTPKEPKTDPDMEGFDEEAKRW